MIQTPYNWLLNKCFYMVVVVSVVSRSGLRIEVCHRNQTKLVLYKLLLSLEEPFKVVKHK